VVDCSVEFGAQAVARQAQIVLIMGSW